MPYDSIDGLKYIDKVVNVDQSPIGRTPRSNPATYTGVFSDIRSLFVNLPEAKIRGYKPGRFSFNVKGGRCETCGGNGYKTIEMNFLPDIQVPCEECHGKRYNRETLEVRYKGKSIADILDMTINQAVEFFENVPDILHKIKTIQDVGLGYIKVGQPSTTLSGGESQRIKLATELAKKTRARPSISSTNPPPVSTSRTSAFSCRCSRNLLTVGILSSSSSITSMSSDKPTGSSIWAPKVAVEVERCSQSEHPNKLLNQRRVIPLNSSKNYNYEKNSVVKVAFLDPDGGTCLLHSADGHQ
jgi:hypothetical protein